MHAYLTELNNSKTKFTFPTMPESVKATCSARYRSYDIIGVGTVKIPKGSEPDYITITGSFFGKKRKNSVLVQKYISPNKIKSMFKKWKDDGTVLRFLVTDIGVNYDVTISSYDFDNSGAFGDVSYTIKLTCNRSIEIYTMAEINNKKKSRLNNDRPKNDKNGTYTVVKGDTLWRIAYRFLGKGTRWTEIYKLNKDIIEVSAKKHGRKNSDNGHWIYPGDTYTIPAK